MSPSAKYQSKAAPCVRCGRPIRFVRNTITDKHIAVEPVPDSDGTISATQTAQGLSGWPVSSERPHTPPNRLYIVHAAVCPVRPGPRTPRQPSAEYRAALALFDENQG